MNKILLFLALLFMTSCTTPCVEEQAMNDLVKRILPNHKSFFKFEKVACDSDFFELEQGEAGKIIIKGNNPVSMSRGLNHYLRNFCHKSTSWCGDNLSDIPSTLPAISKKIRCSASIPYRYYLNYCTYSYTMAFWSWEQWEKEIDRMALQGINMPLMAVNSQYKVWKNTLSRLGLTDKEIKDFLPGAGYEAWWLMGNLEGYGGPVTDEYIEQQAELQTKMLSRMRELGMTPVFQGFYGMVPNILKTKFTNAKIKDQGKWSTYQRPAFLDPTDPLFDKIAAIYYEEQFKLFGEAKFFGGDPFHEGGISEGIDVKSAARKIYAAMKNINPKAVWVLQGWQNNPNNDLMAGLNKGETIILDLMACERPQWGGVKTSMFHKPGGHKQHDWIWCALPNFGGKIGMHGLLSSYASGAVFAKHHPLGKNLCGIGAAPEGIGTNPIDYDMVFDMAWRNDSIDIPAWLSNYAQYRYGVQDASIDKAWTILSKTIYECHNELGGPVESYMCARPADTIKCVSTWGNAEIFYNPSSLVNAWALLLQPKAKLKDIDTYQYDLVDLTRQVLSDYAKHVHKKMIEAFNKKDKEAFIEMSNKFLTLIKDEDELLSTRKEFLLGKWLEEAKNAGTTPKEKQQFVTNAKRQITTWTDFDSSLHDYASKEWSGLLIDFYLPRWEAYITYKTSLLYSKHLPKPDYAKMEQEWVNKNSTYIAEPEGKDAITTVIKLYNKYYKEISNNYNNNNLKLNHK